MAARLDPFVDVMLRERADQLYLLPDAAPPEAADRIDQQSETEFDSAGANGLVRVRIVPEGGRLTAVISAIRRASQEGGAMPVVQSPGPETTGKRPAAQAPPA